MKKLALMLVMALPFVFASCGDDKEEVNVTLDQTSVDINFGGTATVKASEKGCVWSSSNDFVATVDNNGVIKAEHAGTATITASKDGSTATCEVTVKATNNNFNLPILDWGATMATVKSKVTGLTLAREDATTLVYTTNGEFPIYVYGFANDALKASTLSVSEEMDDDKTGLDLYGFLAQRYALVSEDETSYTFADANTLTDADMAVLYTFDADSESVIATWTPVDHTKSGEGFVNSDLHYKHIGVVRELSK